MKDLLRKYPQWSHDCIAVVGNISSNNVQEPKAKAALIWMLGEYAQDMQDAPYILESLIEYWDDELSAEVVNLSCSAYYKLFSNFSFVEYLMKYYLLYLSALQMFIPIPVPLLFCHYFLQLYRNRVHNPCVLIHSENVTVQNSNL